MLGGGGHALSPTLSGRHDFAHGPERQNDPASAGVIADRCGSQVPTAVAVPRIGAYPPWAPKYRVALDSAHDDNRGMMSGHGETRKHLRSNSSRSPLVLISSHPLQLGAT